MDIFSAGCIIAELFSDGQPIFTYGDLLAFMEGMWFFDINIFKMGILKDRIFPVSMFKLQIFD